MGRKYKRPQDIVGKIRKPVEDDGSPFYQEPPRQPAAYRHWLGGTQYGSSREIPNDLSRCPKCKHMWEIEEFVLNDKKGWCKECEREFRAEARREKKRKIRLGNLWRIDHQLRTGNSSEQMLSAIHYIANEATGERGTVGFTRVLDWFADQLKDGTNGQRIRIILTMLHVACVAENALINICHQQKPIDQMRRWGRRGMLRALRQLFKEGMFTLDDLDPAPREPPPKRGPSMKALAWQKKVKRDFPRPINREEPPI